MVLRKFIPFKGRQAADNIYNKQYNFCSNLYQQKELPVEGKQLSIISK